MFWNVSGVVKLDCAVKAPVSLEAQHADVVSYSLAAVKKNVWCNGVCKSAEMREK